MRREREGGIVKLTHICVHHGHVRGIQRERERERERGREREGKREREKERVE